MPKRLDALVAHAFISLNNLTRSYNDFEEDENKCDNDSYKGYKPHAMKIVWL
jgi:hypothetical protein